MTKFIKDNFEYHGGYLHYNTGTERKFVARFKHHGPVTKAKFQRMLIKHYAVEEYFSRLGEAPLEILMNDNILIFDCENRHFILDGKVI